MRVPRTKITAVLIGLSAFFLAGISTHAQEYPNGLSADSVDPITDGKFIGIMRERMDAIRRNEHRPTVALVLSGGGAKGSSHVGVLKVLEDMEIPVDMICGTSMGGLIGGLYSMGYPAEKLDSLLRVQDWGITLTDKVDPSYISFATKDYKSRYLLAVPFHYEKQKVAAKTSKSDEVKYRKRRKDLNLDADAGDLSTQAGVSNFASSLPSGYVYGFNVNNLISSLTVGYQDDMSFTDLPIPFFAVSADMVSCKAKNWGSGSVKNAMRSTMSIPGLFDPVWTDDMVLVDGGTRNNFPVDLAKAMGADYVIGVELSDAAPDYSEVNNLGDLVMQFIKMLGQDAFNKNKPGVDVFIKPNLQGYNMLSFNEVAIDTMIHRGYAAAMEHKDELRTIKNLMNGAKPRLNHPKAVDISQRPVSISSVEFKGVTDAESRMLHRTVKHYIGRTICKDDVDAAMQSLQATGAFEAVTYSLYGDEEPYRLVFNAEKGPVHQFGVGIRMDTKEWVSALVNVGLNSNKLKGSKLDLEACLNKNFHSTLKYSLDLPFLPTINASVKVFNNDLDYYSDNADIFFNTAFRGNVESLYFSNIKWTAFDMKIGVQRKDFTTRKLMAEGLMGIGSGSVLSGNKFYNGVVRSAFLNSTIYTLDDKYYPTKGMDLNINAEWLLSYSFNKPEHTRGPVASIDYTQVFWKGRTNLISDIHARSILNTNPSVHYGNFVGGALSGRYWDQQIPFVGTNRVYSAERQIVAGNLELRFCPAKNLYVSALGGAFLTSDTISDMISDNAALAYGYGGQIGYNTIAGPIKLRVNWSNLFKEVEYYFSVGFDF